MEQDGQPTVRDILRRLLEPLPMLELVEQDAIILIRRKHAKRACPDLVLNEFTAPQRFWTKPQQLTVHDFRPADAPQSPFWVLLEYAENRDTLFQVANGLATTRSGR